MRFTASLPVTYSDLVCLTIGVRVLFHRHLHCSTRVNSTYYPGERFSSLRCNDQSTRVERWRCRLDNTQTLVDKQVKPGYTICKEAVNGQITTILMGIIRWTDWVSRYRSMWFMHRPCHRHIKHTFIYGGMIILIISLWNDHFIKFQPFCMCAEVTTMPLYKLNLDLTKTICYLYGLGVSEQALLPEFLFYRLFPKMYIRSFWSPIPN